MNSQRLCQYSQFLLRSGPVGVPVLRGKVNKSHILNTEDISNRFFFSQMKLTFSDSLIEYANHS